MGFPSCLENINERNTAGIPCERPKSTKYRVEPIEVITEPERIPAPRPAMKGIAWQLELGDEAIARVKETDYDVPWVDGEITPLPGFKRFRPYFVPKAAWPDNWGVVEPLADEVQLRGGFKLYDPIERLEYRNIHAVVRGSWFRVRLPDERTYRGPKVTVSLKRANTKRTAIRKQSRKASASGLAKVNQRKPTKAKPRLNKAGNKLTTKPATKQTAKSATPSVDWISILHTAVQAGKGKPARYVAVTTQGLPVRASWKVICWVNDKPAGEGWGATKQVAKHKAARSAYTTLFAERKP